MKILYAITACLISLFATAQDDIPYAYVDNGEYSSYVFNHTKNDLVKVFADATKIRETPSLTAKSIDSVSQNKVLKIIEETQVITKLGQRSSQWYRVSYDDKKGYIWGGNLAIADYSDKNTSILFGISGTEKVMNDNNEPYERLIGSIKYFKDGTLIDSQNFEAGNSDNLAGQNLEVEKAMRLTNVNYFIKAQVSGEACGIPTYNQTFLVTNQKLIKLPKTVSVSDAGIFYHSETIELPSSENKLKNAFHYINEEAEIVNENTEEMKGEKVTTIYNWDGFDYKITSTKKEAIK